MKVDYKKSLVKFVEKSVAFDKSSRLKALLFLSKVKPNTYIHLRITPENVDDNFVFENYLKKLRIPFIVSRPRGFEEIDRIKGNIAVWKLKGVWLGYDLFKDKKSLKDFKKYKQLLKSQHHKQADLLAGRIYGYPKCCIDNFIKEQDDNFLKKKYSYCGFYKRLHENDKRFPFLQQTPCKINCSASKMLNRKYETAMKKISPGFYKEFTKTKIFKTGIIVDNENDITDKKGSPLWAEKDCFDYVVITKNRLEGRHYLISWLSDKFYEEGSVLSAVIKMKCDFAEIKVKKVKALFDDFIHERHFLAK